MPMDWSEIREIAQIGQEVDCGGEVTVEVPTGFLGSPEWRTAALNLMEEQMVIVGADFAQRLSYVRTRFTEFNRLGLDSISSFPFFSPYARIERRASASLRLGFLSGFAESTELMFGDHDVGESVVSVRLPSVAEARLRPLEIYVTSIRLEEGSLKGTWVGKLITGGLLGTMLTLSYPTASEFINLHNDVERVVQGQSCQVYTDFRFDLLSLRKLTLKQLDFGEPGLPDLARRVRVCNLQLLLNLAVGAPSEIDGKWGPKSQHALEAFAKESNLKPDPSDEVLLGKLLQKLQGRMKMVH
jgi:hypothetical protein